LRFVAAARCFQQSYRPSAVLVALCGRQRVAASVQGVLIHCVGHPIAGRACGSSWLQKHTALERRYLNIHEARKLCRQSRRGGGSLREQAFL
jgi:hypothetical protein